MKRIATWLLSTITVIVLLFGYHTSTSKTFSSDSVIAAPIESSSTSSSSSASSSSGSSPSSSSSGSSSGSSSSGTSGSSSSKTFTGPSVDTRWGPVQVAITVANGKITGVAVPVYPNGNGKDQEINAYALPILADEAVKAQSAKIDMVSGATVTSTGYLTSLQSAIDEANL